jgi:trehalose 6-phosphate synthase
MDNDEITRGPTSENRYAGTLVPAEIHRHRDDCTDRSGRPEQTTYVAVIGRRCCVTVILVSNRVADPSSDGPIEGGLASALLQAVKVSGAIWVGTRAQQSIPERKEPLAALATIGAGTIARVDLPVATYRQYYRGFANSALWPALHSRPDLIRADHDDYAAYREVNRLMALSLRRFMQNGAQIWVHDYHFLTLAAELRRAGIECPVGFFLHTPFPMPAAFASVPHHRDLARAMLNYDLLGFQTEDDQARFAEYVRQDLGMAVENGCFVTATNTRLGSFPIGIDVTSFAEGALKAAARPDIARLRASLQASQLAIGVDRIDYSKGLENRLRAFDRLFRSDPSLKRQLSLLQIALPSRGDIPTYDELRGKLAVLVSEINGLHGEVDWAPIRYLNKGYAQSTLAGLYRTAQVGVVTPLNDGMNLVAKEYVAAQNPLNPGALVLSQFAGAARQLDAALIVNPHDIDGVAKAVRRALSMAGEERRERWNAMMAVLQRDDIDAWYRAFVDALAATARPVRAAPFRKLVSRSTLSSLLPSPFGVAAAKSS